MSPDALKAFCLSECKDNRMSPLHEYDSYIILATTKCNTSETFIFSVTTDLAEALQEFAPRFNLRITNKCDVDSTNIKIYNYPWRLECGCACIPWSLSKHHRLPLRACYAAVKLNAYTTCFLILLSKSKRAEIFILRRLNEQQSYGADQASGIFLFCVA